MDPNNSLSPLIFYKELFYKIILVFNIKYVQINKTLKYIYAYLSY